MTAKLDDIVLKRNIGRNAPDLICQLATSGTIPSLEEFITNAHDADAEHVTVHYNPKKDTLVIEDDGTGMNARDLTGFYRLGDSQKAEKPVTAKGRKCIGKFGIATILLKSLAKEYTLETFKDGECITVHERFDGDLSADQNIPYKLSDAPKDKHGTKLTLTQLAFKEDDGKFSIKDFIKRLQWDVPIRPDFEVTVNNTTIVSKRVANADEFQFAEENPAYGSAHGTFYLTRRASPDSGVHIYVNGRRVGDSKVLLHKFKSASRIVGIVNADGLERAILFDRGRFKEDDAGYVALTKALRKFISKIEYTLESEREKRRFKRAQTEASETLSDAQRMLNSQLSIFSAKGKAVGLEFGAVNGEIAAVYDPVEARIRINGALPQFRVTDTFDVAFYRSAIIDASIDALVAHAVGRNATIANFLRAKQDYVQQLYRQTGKKQQASSGTLLAVPTPAARVAALASAPAQPLPVRSDAHAFSDIRMYESSEVSSISGLLLGTVNRLFESGALKTSNNKAKGEHIKETLKRIDGYTSLHEILHKMVEPNNLTLKYNAATENLKTIAGEIPYLRDFGEKKPCFFIRNQFVPEVARALNKKISRAQLLDNLQKAMDKHFTLSETAHALGANAEDVKKMLNFVDQHGLHLPKKTDNGEPRYHFFYAAKAYNDMRSGAAPKNTRDVTADID